MGVRELPFGRELYMDATDFEEIPPPQYKRLSLGAEVRLRGSYVIRCEEVVKDADGRPVELICSYDEATLGVNPQGRKVAGVIHWVPAAQALDVEVRIYDRLFNKENPDDKAIGDYKECLNPDSMLVLAGCKAEPSLRSALPEASFQFEREGYFCVDRFDSTEEKLVFNRTVTLKDSWAKISS